MKKQIITWALILLGSTGVVIGVEKLAHKVNPSAGLASNTNNSTIANTDAINSIPVNGDASYGLDLSNDEFLLGFSHNAFVGKVLSKVGSKNIGLPPSDTSYRPTSQYAVDVISNIKGNLKGTVVVNQSEFPEKFPLLQPGSTYIFVAAYNNDENVYTIVDTYHYHLLSNDANLSNTDLKVLADNSDRVKALQAAYPNEQVPSFIIEAKRDWNSYASRRYDASGNLIDDTVELAAGRSIPSRAPIAPTLTQIPVVSAALSPTDQRDNQRVGGLRQMQLAFELYFEAYQTYPQTAGDLVPTYLGVLPTDPSTGQLYSYVPDSAAPRQHYILSTTLENSQSSQLQNDVDGSHLGVNCADPVYCVGENPSMVGKHVPSVSRSPIPTPVPPPPTHSPMASVTPVPTPQAGGPPPVPPTP